MKRSDLLRAGISHVLDDALSPDHTVDDFIRNGRGIVIGYQCGFEQLLVGVISYLPDVQIDPDEALDIADDYLREIGWLQHDTETTVYVWSTLQE